MVRMKLSDDIFCEAGTDPPSRWGPPPTITFDRFVRCCVVIKTLTESFQQVDTDRDGWIQLNYESFLGVRSVNHNCRPIGTDESVSRCSSVLRSDMST